MSTVTAALKARATTRGRTLGARRALRSDDMGET